MCFSLASAGADPGKGICPCVGLNFPDHVCTQTNAAEGASAALVKSCAKFSSNALRTTSDLLTLRAFAASTSDSCKIFEIFRGIVVMTRPVLLSCVRNNASNVNGALILGKRHGGVCMYVQQPVHMRTYAHAPFLLANAIHYGVADAAVAAQHVAANHAVFFSA